MSLFGNKSEKQIEAELMNSNNTIAKGTTITGNLETFGSIRIDGKLIGNIKSGSKVVLGPSALVEGEIESANAEIEGEIIGKITIKETLTLRSTAKIQGDIQTLKLVVESGATFDGTCKMGSLGNDKTSILNGKNGVNHVNSKIGKQTKEAEKVIA